MGMRLVYDLFIEMEALFRLISQGLVNSDGDFQPMGPKGYLLPLPKKGRTKADRLVATDMGLIVAVGTTSADEADGGDGGEKDTADVYFTPDTQFLLIRALLLDTKAMAEDFTPVLIASLAESFTLAPGARKRKKKVAVIAGPQTEFVVKRAGIKVLAKALLPETKTGDTVSVNIPRGQFSATLADVLVTPLAEIDSEEAVNQFVDKLVNLGN